MIFDVIELITFVFAFIAFIFIIMAYFMQKQQKKLPGGFLVISLFVLLNRIFTNIEALFFRDFFNLLEHLCIAAAALTFVFMAWLTYKRGIK